ncbi:hypothetical protein BVRB_6g127230 [Beta vulgaris subsp. vulgaris]|nr:hypothetical protein BVRB_6g127230 [Beta vulgaris subsp. vulgaris]
MAKATSFGLIAICLMVLLIANTEIQTAEAQRRPTCGWLSIGTLFRFLCDNRCNDNCNNRRPRTVADSRGRFGRCTDDAGFTRRVCECNFHC